MTTKLNRYLALTCLAWIVCVLAINPLRAQDINQVDNRTCAPNCGPAVDPKDAQIAALTARVAQLEKRVALLEEFKKTAWPLIQTLVAPLNAVEQQLAQLDAQSKEKK